MKNKLLMASLGCLCLAFCLLTDISSCKNPDTTNENNHSKENEVVKHKEKRFVSRDTDFVSCDSIYIEQICSIYDLHFCLTESNSLVFADTVNLTDVFDSNPLMKKKKDVLFDVLLHGMKRSPIKIFRESYGGDSPYIFEFRFYRNDTMRLDTALCYDADYRFFSDEILLSMQYLGSLCYFYREYLEKNARLEYERRRKERNKYSTSQ